MGSRCRKLENILTDGSAWTEKCKESLRDMTGTKLVMLAGDDNCEH